MNDTVKYPEARTRAASFDGDGVLITSPPQCDAGAPWEGVSRRDWRLLQTVPHTLKERFQGLGLSVPRIKEGEAAVVPHTTRWLCENGELRQGLKDSGPGLRNREQEEVKAVTGPCEKYSAFKN